ncbi:MAG: tyrosine-type recombinase/integrase [Sulfuriflexus sp.]|nr:tyrosine-type recombinase/integrase [Sulfuriflexus sp.]
MGTQKTSNHHNVRFNPLRKSFVHYFQRCGHKAAYISGREKTVSNTTRMLRHGGMVNVLNKLVKIGFKVKKLESLKEKHIKALVPAWEEEGLSPKTISTKTSYFRTMAEWAGKYNMVKSYTHYAKNPDLLKVKTVPSKAKDWSTQEVDPVDKINEVFRDNIYCGLILMTMYVFGMRIQEAILFRPHQNVSIADGIVTIIHGTKGGRLRTWPITRDDERQAIELLQYFIPDGCNVIAPASKYFRGRYMPNRKPKKLKTFEKSCYNCFNKHGISKKEGLVPHGLRHERAHELFRDITGFQSPLRDKSTPTMLTKELNQAGRDAISSLLGHNRDSISSAYIGSSPKLPQCEIKDVARMPVPQLIKISESDE